MTHASRQSTLFEVLRSKPEGEVLAHRLLAEVRRTAEPQLSHIRDIFPHFTDHSISHSDNVLKIMDWLIPDDIKDQLNAWELYFLMAATYLHDIGMVEACPGPPGGPAWQRFLTQYSITQGQTLNDPIFILQAKRHYIRDNHHIRSEQYIRARWRELGLTAANSPAEGAIVGRIALGHRKVRLDDRERYGPTAIGNENRPIHRDLLAAYLRLADELDTTAFRTPWSEFDVIPPLDEVSSLEWGKHLSISGVYAERGILVLTGECSSASVYLRLLRLQREVSEKLDELREMIKSPYQLNSSHILIDPIPYHTIHMKIEHIGYIPMAVSFELDRSAILNLLLSERLYGDPTVCIRELLQNSMDACRQAAENRPPHWKPIIQVREEQDGRIIIVEDNGAGMDRNIIEKYFSKIGVSYYKSSDFTGKFLPIGEFGVGILSCFMMADKIEIETKHDLSEPFDLHIDDVANPFIVLPGSRERSGTLVRLYLKNSFVKNIDIIERVRHFVRHPYFSIDIICSDGKCEQWLGRSLVVTCDELADRYGVNMTSRKSELCELVHRYSSTYNSDNIDAGLTLSEFIESEFFPNSMIARDLGGNVGLEVDGISQNGFFIDRFEETRREWTYARDFIVNLHGNDRLALTVNRSNAFGETSDNAWKSIMEVYARLVNSIYDNTKIHYPKRNWWSFYNRVFSFAMDKIPPSFQEAFDENAIFCCLTSDGAVSLSVKEIRDWNGEVWVYPMYRHKTLALMGGIIPSDMLIVSSPEGNSPTNEKRWWQLALGIEMKHDSQEWLMKAARDIIPIKLGESYLMMADFGKRLGPWLLFGNARILVEGARWPITQIYDRRHPFSELLVQLSVGEVPRAVMDSIRDIEYLVGRGQGDAPADLFMRVVHVAEAHGFETAVKAVEAADWEGGSPAAHICPYGSI